MENHSLSHTRWECLYHIVWIPKYRRKRLYGDLRRELGEILAALVEQMDGVEKVEGSACADHIHICLRIAPKHAVSSVVGKLKGRSAIVLFGRDRTLWARGYYVSTVGLDEAAVRKYIRSQEEASAIE